MAEVLVLVDHVDGQVRKSTAEALTAAARLGEPECRMRRPMQAPFQILRARDAP